MTQNRRYGAALETAMRLLARRSHTRYEIRQKLRQRGVDPGVAESVIAECERRHYIDDEETARQYFQVLKRRGYGPRRVRQEMRKKGLEGDVAEGLIAEYVGGPEELANARRILEKKAMSLSRETDARKRREKIYRFLGSRGFSGAVISELLRKRD